jgi:hypothetical protein
MNLKILYNVVLVVIVKSAAVAVHLAKIVAVNVVKK